MRLRLVLALISGLLAAACGDDDDTVPPGTDAAVDGGAMDGPAVVYDAPPGGVDARLGNFCATTAVDGGPGSCDPGTVCCANGSTVCTEPSDCPGGAQYVTCTTSATCPGGRVCCATAAMGQFCTKTSSCTAYGGTVVP